MTEQEFLASLLDMMEMSDEEQAMAQQAIIDMATGNEANALHTGVVIAERTLTRMRTAIQNRQKEL